MLDFYEKRRLKGIVFSKPMIGVLLFLGIWIGISAYERYEAERETAEKRDEKLIERDRLNQKAAVLEAKVKQLESDRGIEGEIREQFDIAKANETVVVIVDDAASAREKEEKETLPLPKSGFTLLLEWLKFW